MAKEAPHNAAAADAQSGDWLGYDAYAQALWSRVVTALDKDKDGKTPLGDDPFVIGIFGEWGAGKSHLLKLIYRQAEDQSARDIANRILHATSGLPLTVTVPVMFQPWKYEHEQHLHVPFAVHVADALDEAWKKLPADFEQVKVLMGDASKCLAEVGETLETAATFFGKVCKLWSSAKTAVQSDAAAVVVGTADVLLAGAGLPPALTLGRRKFLDSFPAGDEEEADELTKAKADKVADAKPNRQERQAKAFANLGNGLDFYRIHKLLRALTRPKLDKQRLKDAGLKIAEGIEFDLRINFVIFIDDLDRCMPEKALQTLELIKTTFNTECFAFVLALDDEVIERGIGHRYQAYNFAGKKPEMPITGFEYLEKIVHLPFRLPTMTRMQAESFVRRYEEAIASSDSTMRWFGATPLRPASALETRRPTSVVQLRSNLLPLALAGFDAYVPRKLIRLVELLHQTARVAVQEKIPRLLSQRHDDGQIDLRVVLFLAQVQLFHPDLFRLFKRRDKCFRELFDGFTPTVGRMLHSEMSDIDLWHWTAYNVDHPDYKNRRPSDRKQAIEWMAMVSDGQRSEAQQIRLPLVEAIVEYRAAQRHVFDVLKFAKALHDDGLRFDETFRLSTYTSLLTPSGVSVPVTPAVSAAPSTKRSNKIDVDRLFESLVSVNRQTQEELAAANGLTAGEIVQDADMQALQRKLDAWLASSSGDNELKCHLLMRGLFYLAPYIASGEGQRFWDLVKGSVDFTRDIDSDLRHLWGDLRCALGSDSRFDPGNLYLLRDRFHVDMPEFEPMPGFIKVPAGQFTMGSQKEFDNLPKAVEIEDMFYISRSLVTVDQFGLFIRDGGYENPDWWDRQGLQWLDGKIEIPRHSTIFHTTYKNWLTRRGGSLRLRFADWIERKTLGSHPVSDLSWFEARAYVRWLNAQLAESMRDNNIVPAGYEVQLPTEPQWERAAKATSMMEADDRIWPWRDSIWSWGDGEAADQFANVSSGRHCAVGLYQPNPIGLWDMAGNGWEWMNNLYAFKFGRFTSVRRAQELGSNGSLADSDSPAVRGGPCSDGIQKARCSYRFKVNPGGWQYSVGLRVVLSRAAPAGIPEVG